MISCLHYSRPDVMLFSCNRQKNCFHFGSPY